MKTKTISKLMILAIVFAVNFGAKAIVAGIVAVASVYVSHGADSSAHSSY